MMGAPSVPLISSITGGGALSSRGSSFRSLSFLPLAPPNATHPPYTHTHARTHTHLHLLLLFAAPIERNRGQIMRISVNAEE